MQGNSNKIIIGLAIVFATGLFFCIYKLNNQPTIAYVRSSDLIYKYEGMKEAQKKFEEKNKAWKANFDTLKVDFDRSLSKYQSDYPTLDAKQKEEREKILSMQEGNLQKYNQNLSQNAKKEETEMTEGVLNQINAFVEEYAKKHGYSLVIGTTNSGNLLYGEQKYDITDELLSAINEDYKSGAIKTTEEVK